MPWDQSFTELPSDFRGVIERRKVQLSYDDRTRILEHMLLVELPPLGNDLNTQGWGHNGLGRGMRTTLCGQGGHRHCHRVVRIYDPER